MKLSQTFSAALIAIVFAPACKPGGNSSVKTLDAVASGGITKLYQCKGNQNIKIPEGRIVMDASSEVAKATSSEQSVLRAAVGDYFSALDPAIQQLFLSLGGQVLITDDNRIGSYCNVSRNSAPENQKTQDNTHGCFLFVDDPAGQKDTVFTIVQTASAEKIRYYGPQIFGYLYAQFYSRLAPAQRQGASFSLASNESMQFISYKERIADAFLSDMLLSKKFNFSALTPLLGENAEKELRGQSGTTGLLGAVSFQRTSEPSAPDNATKERRRTQIRDYFFAHAFQSMNCDKEALEVTRTGFPKSHAAFQEIQAGLVSLSRELTGSQVSSGFGLSLAGNERADVSPESLAVDGGLQQILGMMMPLLGQLGIPGSGQLASVLPALLNGGGGGNLGSLLPALSGLLTQGSLGKSGGLFNAVSAAGCSGGNCGRGNCNGGSCRGGNCATRFPASSAPMQGAPVQAAAPQTGGETVWAGGNAGQLEVINA